MSSSDNDKLIKEATDLLDSSAVMPSYASNLISRLQVALGAEQARADKAEATLKKVKQVVDNPDLWTGDSARRPHLNAILQEGQS